VTPIKVVLLVAFDLEAQCNMCHFFIYANGPYGTIPAAELGSLNNIQEANFIRQQATKYNSGVVEPTSISSNTVS
jgi:hypothetical protein